MTDKLFDPVERAIQEAGRYQIQVMLLYNKGLITEPELADHLFKAAYHMLHPETPLPS